MGCTNLAMVGSTMVNGKKENNMVLDFTRIKIAPEGKASGRMAREYNGMMVCDLKTSFMTYTDISKSENYTNTLLLF